MRAAAGWSIRTALRLAAVRSKWSSAIAAHEFFHAWNVKRIRPQSLEPVDYTKEQYSRALWFAEGVTSTYGSFALERSGIWTKDKLYDDLAQQVCELQSRPAHKWQSVEESSLDTWFDKYDAYNLADRSISYYNKGQLIGDMLDLAIREATDNHKSLDDVLRSLNDLAKQGKFYDESAGIRSVVEEVSGTSFEDFFRRYVSGLDEIPYDQFLAHAGLSLKSEFRQSADAGFLVGRSSDGPTVVAVTPGSGAQAAGLRVDDILVELNGAPISGRISAWMRERTPGETIKLKVRRDGVERELSFAVGIARRESLHGRRGGASDGEAASHSHGASAWNHGVRCETGRSTLRSTGSAVRVHNCNAENDTNHRRRSVPRVGTSAGYAVLHFVDACSPARLI